MPILSWCKQVTGMVSVVYNLTYTYDGDPQLDKVTICKKSLAEAHTDARIQGKHNSVYWGSHRY